MPFQNQEWCIDMVESETVYCDLFSFVLSVHFFSKETKSSMIINDYILLYIFVQYNRL
jgi:hypothetical protein